MNKWNDPSAMTLTFQVEASEDVKAFFDRMQKESKETEEAYKERIRQLFNEHIISIHTAHFGEGAFFRILT